MSDYQAVQAALRKYVHDSPDPDVTNPEVAILLAHVDGNIGAAALRLMALPGIGPVMALRVLAAIGRLEGWDG